MTSKQLFFSGLRDHNAQVKVTLISKGERSGLKVPYVLPAPCVRRAVIDFESIAPSGESGDPAGSEKRKQITQGQYLKIILISTQHLPFHARRKDDD